MVLLVPKQLRMTGMTGSVPYYGGRMSPAQAYAASHPTAPPPAAAPPPPRGPVPPAPTPAPPETPRRDPLAALDELLESGVITEAEHQQLRDRLEP